MRRRDFLLLLAGLPASALVTGPGGDFAPVLPRPPPAFPAGHRAARSDT